MVRVFARLCDYGCAGRRGGFALNPDTWCRQTRLPLTLTAFRCQDLSLNSWAGARRVNLFLNSELCLPISEMIDRMRTAPVEARSVALADKAGKYLTFELGKESYGVPVLTVREIIRTIDITPVPLMPDYVKGVINLRGKVIPVIDLRIRFGLANAEYGDTTCTIVSQVNHADGAQSLLGLVVDAVEEVSQVKSEDLEPPPNFGGALNTDYIVGMARIKGGIKSLLDVDKIIAAEMTDTIDAMNNQQASL